MIIRALASSLIVCLGVTTSAFCGENSKEFPIYPDSNTALNPRIACVPPTAGGQKGKAMPVETEFTYQLSPFLDFKDGGKLDVQIRDNLRRSRKTLLSLVSSDGGEIVLNVSPASEGRKVSIDLIDAGRTKASLPLPVHFDEDWKEVTLRWDSGVLTVTVAGKEAGKLPLKPLGKPFVPSSLTLQAYSIDELLIVGKGRFTLDWENGYAAKVQAAATDSVTGRVFGFDTYVVSQDPTKRDYPVIEAVNTGAKPAEVSFTFALKSEVRFAQESWEEHHTLKPGEAAWLPIVFPKSLVSDVYHLSISSRGLSNEIKEQRNFLFVERQTETPGPMKFGLHDSDRNTFGEWPDALPIGISHLYARWRIIQGPPWVKDANGEYGMLPDTPPAEWNWDRRLDWAIGQGLVPYVCVEATPALPWMRERSYDDLPGAMEKVPWGLIGGFPRLDLYGKFAHALVERYKGKVPRYEIENEPYFVNHTGQPPEDYVKIARAFSEEARAVDPAVRIFANCGMGEFMNWTQPILDDGIAAWVDGFSLHTYTTPQLPDQANLLGNFVKFKAALKDTGKDLAFGCSEVGVYTALREEPDHAIPPARLTELINEGAPGLTVPGGWPHYALDEETAGISIVENVVENFAAGSKFFIFFGWNPQWPAPDWWKASKNKLAQPCFAMISAAKDGTRTPSLYTLAAGVLTSQLEGILPGSGEIIQADGVVGGSFKRADQGETIVLWSSLGKRSVLLETSTPDLEIVTIYGDSHTYSAKKSAGKYLHVVELSNAPLYLQLKNPGFTILPSPVISIRQKSQSQDSGQLQFTLVNQSSQPWEGRVSYSAPAGWRVEPAESEFNIGPHGRKNLEITCHAKSEGGSIEANVILPDNRPFTFSIPVSIRPSIMVAATGDRVRFPDDAMTLNRPDQVFVGHPPELASLQEAQYWGGPSELSGKVRLAWNVRSLFVRVDVHDATPRLPDLWPSVNGSCLEFFFDTRSMMVRASRGDYEQGVHQIVVEPALTAGQSTRIWDVSAERFGALKNIVADSVRTAPDSYQITLEIPWSSLGLSPTAGESFGFDVAIDGPDIAKGGRKSQLILFGNALDSRNTSAFGNAILARP